MKTTYKLNGKTVSARAFRRHRLNLLPVPSGRTVQAYSDTHPGSSLAMGCATSEIGLMNKTIAECGIAGIKYVERRNSRGVVIGGEPVITNNSRRNGRRKWAEIYGNMTMGCPLRDYDGYD